MIKELEEIIHNYEDGRSFLETLEKRMLKHNPKLSPDFRKTSTYQQSLLNVKILHKNHKPKVAS